ncbi:MAG: TIM barrel protein [Planctomycetales bacterium]|nr:TIM barrel protein [Planctomycetales bacterium]
MSNSHPTPDSNGLPSSPEPPADGSGADARTWSRRGWLGATAGSAVASTVAGVWPSQSSGAPMPAPMQEPNGLKGRINHSVVHWCFNPMTVEELAGHAVAMGIKSVELVAPENWPMLRKHGLTVAIASSHGFARGWNHRENWDFCREKIESAIHAAADFGCQRVITFSGMLDGIDPEEGRLNTIAGLKTVVGLAEQKGITLCLEVLNTRVAETMKGHPGYQADTAEWAIDVCDEVGSDHLKILYDIYHQQIMQGDVIARIHQFKDYIGHYHTAGVPGRRELDDLQEINYPAVMRAIVETGYEGFVGHEFIPTWEDPVAALRHAVGICDV